MAEEKNPEQNVEPNDAERAQFEQDVLKAAQDAMNLEAEANASAGSATDNANAEKPADVEGQNAEAPKAEEKAAEQPAAPSAEEVLKQQLAEVEKGIENMLNAMQAGVLTKSTKKRLDDLEARKEQLEIDISREELQQEVLTRDMVVMWLRKMKELDLTNDDNKRILIDTFVNSIQVFNDKLIISFNNSEGTSEVSLLTEGCSSGRGVGELIIERYSTRKQSFGRIATSFVS